VPDYLVKNGFIGMKQCRHGLFMFNCNDRFVGRSLDLYGEWCEAELELLLPLVRAGDVVIDVGANIGTHAVPFASAAGRSGRVIAFEPQRAAFQMLCGNIALNCLGSAQCRQEAVGDTVGQVTVPVLAPEESRNFAAVALGDDTAGEPVPMVTIDSLALEACRLIKIDVEGMEPAVIRGARSTIDAHRPLLFVENNTIDGASATIAAVFEAGYDAWWHLALYYSETNFFGNRENVFAQYQPEANLLCVPCGTDAPSPELVACTGLDDNWRKALERGIAAGNPRFLRK